MRRGPRAAEVPVRHLPESLARGAGRAPARLGGSWIICRRNRVVNDDHSPLRLVFLFVAIVLPLRPGLRQGEVKARAAFVALLLLPPSYLFDDERVEHGAPPFGSLTAVASLMQTDRH